MAIEDSNPERRNLVVLSMAIIAFYVGGCEIPATGEIELPLIKLKFTDAYHLAWLVWMMLFWFWFRYWVSMRHEVTEKINGELHNSRHGLSLFDNSLRQLFGLNKSFPIDLVRFSRCKTSEPGYTDLFLVVHPDPEDTHPEINQRSEIYYDVRRDSYARLIFTVALAKLVFTHPTLTGYYAPYFLVLFAIWLGIHDLFQRIEFKSLITSLGIV